MNQIEGEKNVHNAVLDPYERTAFFREPPQGFWATCKHLGPGMILAGAIVGSGELIVTMKLGAEAGFILLWFVLISCVIKVVVQVELARLTISSGRTFLEVFNSLPGPRGKRPSWLTVRLLVVVIVASFLGLAAYAFWVHRWTDTATPTTSIGLGIVAMVLAVVVGTAVIEKLRATSRQRIARSRHMVGGGDSLQLSWFMWFWMSSYLLIFINGGAIVGGAGQSLQMAFPNWFGDRGAIYWAIVVALFCGGLLLSGRYAVLERVSIGLVVSFTLITVVCTGLLQWTNFAIRVEDVRAGISFGFPPEMTPILVLLAMTMYANTGVTGNEMISYTYWCLEKGYARNAGLPDAGDAWVRRARGWIRVMYIDAFLTMIVYTVGTICFYLLGAAILHAKGSNPDGTETLEILGQVYTETLGGWAATLFIVGSFFVLFSTTLSNVAAHSRIITDGLGVMQLINVSDYKQRLRCIRILVILLLIVFVFAYSCFQNPPLMLIIASMYTVVLLPVLGLGTLYIRFRLIDQRVAPGRLITSLLWVAGLSLAVISPATLLLSLCIKQEWISF